MTIVCRLCGTENNNDEVFCRNEGCGAFLEWAGARVAPVEEEAAAGAGEDDAGATSTALAGDNGEAGTGAQLPVAIARPTTLSVVPVRPSVEWAPPPETEAEELEPEVGQVVCPVCSAGNPAHIRFCRRCATPLAGVPVIRPPWWRRFLAGWREPLGAGERRWGGRRRRLVRTPADWARTVLKVLLLIVAIVALVIAVLWSWNSRVERAVRDAITSARYIIWPQYDPIRPAGTGYATTFAPRHRARQAFDKDWNTFWATKPGKAVGARLVVRLEPPSDIDKVGVFAGDPTASRLVPKRVQFAFYRWAPRMQPTRGTPWRQCQRRDRVTGATSRRRQSTAALRRSARTPCWRLIAIRPMDLLNEPGYQRSKLNVDGVRRVVVTIRSVHEGPARSAALTEVEFFDKR